ncbi:Retrovirus capsid C-terminal protein [Dioscorea alata]|uniref:Retrovirus capsid C-terminal protein n=2 Tax=Dioscorea alata TaxID=55571 RepID=A0ACB7UI90_DIOAL|nr:Retrovirus capsid C-terminal protein [Dioscorea alata]
MVYTYTPAYYSSFQDTITSLCKSILPFSMKNRRLPADHKLAKRHAESLKWQQESFHRILQLIGLHKEGMVSETEVSAFRVHLLDTLVASPAEQEPPNVIRDKLLFLKELLYAKCISDDEYHSSKRPLLQRLAVQGADVDCRDIVVGAPTSAPEEEWSVINLKDDEESPMVKTTKQRTPFKSLMSNVPWKEKAKETSKNNSILMPESTPVVAAKAEKGKRKPFRSLFQKDGQDENGEEKGGSGKTGKKKHWGLDGLRKWRRGNDEDEEMTDCLGTGERSDGAPSISMHCALMATPAGEVPDTKKIKNKLHSDGNNSDFFIDKVLGQNIKKELSRIQTELCATNPNLNFSDDQMEAISTKLPVDKADLNHFFPKSWCERYGDIVLDVVKKEFKDHVGEMENKKSTAGEKNGGGNTEKWVAFPENDNNENLHPNLFASQDHQPQSIKPWGGTANNSFYDVQNPFWTSKGH